MTVGIIGGGIMGLVIGSKLSRKGYLVHVFESEEQLGGLATWFDYKAFIWDKFYHVILSSDSALIGVINDLNIGDKLHWSHTKTGFFWKGKYISMNNHMELLTFPALNLYQKIRLVAGILFCQLIQDREKLHDVKADKWLATVFGKGVYATIWDPLLESKFGALKSMIPASIMYSTIMRYRSTRNTTTGKETMGYLVGGLKTLIDALRDDIVTHGGKITCDCKVNGIKNNQVIDTSHGKFSFDRMINTLPTFIFKKIAPHITKLHSNQPQFLGVICLSLILSQPLSPYYVTNLIDKGFPFTGIIEPSNVADPEQFHGKHLVMLPRYDLPNSPWFDKSDDEIRSIFLQNLERICPNIIIEESFVNKARFVQAIWIDKVPIKTTPFKSEDGRVWSINSELAQGNVLSNNNIVEIATAALTDFS